MAFKELLAGISDGDVEFLREISERKLALHLVRAVDLLAKLEVQLCLNTDPLEELHMGYGNLAFHHGVSQIREQNSEILEKKTKELFGYMHYHSYRTVEQSLRFKPIIVSVEVYFHSNRFLQAYDSLGRLVIGETSPNT